MVFRVAVLSLLLGIAGLAQSQIPPMQELIRNEGLARGNAFKLLTELTKQVGHRLSGSAGAAKAVEWGQRRMKDLGFENVRLVPCKVPHWVRGKAEKASFSSKGKRENLSLLALGGSIATPRGGIEAEVIEVRSLEDVEMLGDRVKGKIIFFNRPMSPIMPNTFRAYGLAVDQRSAGPAAAAKLGAKAALVRSMTLALDDVPHSGATNFGDGPKIPAAALSTVAADRLSAALKTDPALKVKLETFCENLPEVDSASVVGEIRGAEKPEEVIVIGGHLDSWDVGEGAHDDGAGVVQSMEALSILKRIKFKPTRTIRVVLFMNEENGLRGGKSYAESVKNEKHIAAIESDAGGFAPRAFGVTSTPEQLAKIQSWLPSLSGTGIEKIGEGGGGADIGPLREQGTVLIGLQPESHRYFDYHHARTDTLDKVNPRELAMGAIAMAILAWQLSEEGI